jgi:large subunit ribosomal protein L13
MDAFPDMGDHVIVINARKAVFMDQRQSRRFTVITLGTRAAWETSVAEMFERHPERVIELAIRGMMPKNKLGKAMAKKLKVYGDAEHPHPAQRPRPYEIPSRSSQN